MRGTIVILGGDGYLGWPLSLKVALEHPSDNVIIVDNEWRRNISISSGFKTLYPIAKPGERVAAFKRVHKQHNLHYVHMDINGGGLDAFIKSEKPHTIFHLAQQGSATYSMKGLEESLFTLRNNEEGNMRLLWAVKQHVPQAHIIKIGSFGEYAEAGIDIPQGYFTPSYRGREANREMPYPRQSDDIYHITKINDSNFSAMACRIWGLRITDVMQSTIFGFVTDEMCGCRELFTRCDYDHIYGTVVNRFLVQSVCGYPLTVYGNGNQRTGLMALRDSVNSLVSFITDIPVAGVHRVINHVTETDYSIRELAANIKEIMFLEGYRVTINSDFNPRLEKIDKKRDYLIDTTYAGHDKFHSRFEDVLKESLMIVEQFSCNILEDFFEPKIFWNKINEYPSVRKADDGIVLTEDEVYWDNFRLINFPSDRINLNPGTLGTTSQGVQRLRGPQSRFQQDDGYPLGWYEQARKSHLRIKALGSELWPAASYGLTVTYSTTQAVNIIALSLIRFFYKTMLPPFKVVTTLHEHHGGIGAFENLPEYQVYYLSDEILGDREQLANKMLELKPALAVFSHVFYATGILPPVQDWMTITKENVPECKIMLDVAQSLGVLQIPFGLADLVIGSTHKWLFGPHGGGLMWIKDDCHSCVESVFWAGDGFAYSENKDSLSIPGGQDFMMYPLIEESLLLYRKVGVQTVLKRSTYLRDLLKNKLELVLEKHGVEYVMLQNKVAYPVISLAFKHFNPYPLYSYLNENKIHAKCIKNKIIKGSIFHILRIGVPYFETLQRLDNVVLKIDCYLLENKQNCKIAESRVIQTLELVKQYAG